MRSTRRPFAAGAASRRLARILLAIVVLQTLGPASWASPVAPASAPAAPPEPAPQTGAPAPLVTRLELCPRHVVMYVGEVCTLAPVPYGPGNEVAHGAGITSRARTSASST